MSKEIIWQHQQKLRERGRGNYIIRPSHLDLSNEWMHEDFRVLDLSTRVVNGLKWAFAERYQDGWGRWVYGKLTIKKVLSLSDEQILSARNIGIVSLDELHTKLEEYKKAHNN